MFRTWILTVGLCSAIAFTAGAANNVQAGKRTPPKKEQKAVMKEIRDKYDKDGNGKLSKEERGAISAEDKAKLKEFRAARKKAKSKL
jgi:hypothetical protein